MPRRDFPLIPPTVERALLLYGCAFDGVNDGRHVREAGVGAVTVVDIDQEAITRMAQSYPHGWEFVCSDAMEYVDECLHRNYRKFDLVVADPFGGGQMDLVRENIGVLKLLARDMLVVGARTTWQVPSDMTITPRSFDYCWWVWTP